MKKALLLFGFLCVFGIHTASFADISLHDGAICVVDEHEEAEERLLETFEQPQSSALGKWVAAQGASLLQRYLQCKGFAKRMAHLLKKKCKW